MTVTLMWRAALVGLLAATLQLAGCGSTPSKDEAPEATAERLYKDARDDMESGSYERAIKTLERVESLAAGSLLAQQALLDTAYLNWRSGERAAALTALDRFIKLNPSSPALDYALYLRGVVNFIGDLGLFGTAFGQDVSERDQQAARESWQAIEHQRAPATCATGKANDIGATGTHFVDDHFHLRIEQFEQTLPARHRRLQSIEAAAQIADRLEVAVNV